MKLKYVLNTGAMLLAWSITQANAASWYIGYGTEFGESAPVFDSDNDEWDYDGGVGNTLLTGIAFNQHWALELGYTTWGFGSQEIPEPADDSTPSKDEVDNSFFFGMRNSYPIVAGLNLEWGTGLHRWTKTEIRYFEDEFYDPEQGEYVYGEDTSRKSESDVDFYYFAGAKYQFLPNLSMGLSYSKYNMNLENIDAWRLSIAYYFGAKKGSDHAFDPKDVYVRGLLTYNRANISEEWQDFYIVDDDGFYDYEYDEKIEEDTTSIGFGLLVGFNLSKHWAAEAGYIKLGDASLSATLSDGIDTRKVEFYKRSVDAFSYGIAVHFSPYSRVSPYLRIGMLDWNQDIDRVYDSEGESGDLELDSVGTYLGFGISFGITPQLAIVTELNRYAYGLESDEGDDLKDYTNNFSFGVQYRFGALDRPQPMARPDKDFKTYPVTEPSGAINRTQRSVVSDSANQESGRAYQADDKTEKDDDRAGKSKNTACDPRHKHLFFDCD